MLTGRVYTVTVQSAFVTAVLDQWDDLAKLDPLSLVLIRWNCSGQVCFRFRRESTCLALRTAGREFRNRRAACGAQPRVMVETASSFKQLDSPWGLEGEGREVWLSPVVLTGSQVPLLK